MTTLNERTYFTVPEVLFGYCEFCVNYLLVIKLYGGGGDYCYVGLHSGHLCDRFISSLTWLQP